MLAGIVSLAIHATIIGFLMWHARTVTLGGGGLELEAVNVEIVPASALESVTARPSADAAGAGQPTARAPGLEATVEQAAASAPPPPKPQEKANEALLTPDPQPTPDAEFAAADVVKPELKLEPKIEPHQQHEPSVTPEAALARAQPAREPGGTASRADRDSVDQAGSARASPGQLARYAVEVRMALGKTRPRHSGGRGRVQIAFALDDSGKIRFAQIARPSGSDRLDHASLAAIRSTSFPRPPAGMTDGQRTFLVPFEFK